MCRPPVWVRNGAAPTYTCTSSPTSFTCPITGTIDRLKLAKGKPIAGACSTRELAYFKDTGGSALRLCDVFGNGTSEPEQI